MVEEVVTVSEASVTEVVQILEPNQTSVEATVESTVQEGTESTCNDANNNNAAESAADDVCDEEHENTLDFAEELTVKGSGFLKAKDFSEAVDCFSRALEIRVKHYGELAAECINAYYKYGSALLKKAQAEADPFGNMPKKEGEVQQESSIADDSVKDTANGETLAASVVSSNPERQGSSSGQEVCIGSAVKDHEEDGEDCNDDELADADADVDEDDSDLDMAWKMLDIARAITDKQSIDTIEKVDILCDLAEISLEREDIESSLSDYKKALSVVEKLVEPDSRRIAELNFLICICLENGCQAKEAIPYCQNALVICKARMERLNNEIKGAAGSANSSTVSEIDEGIQQSSNVTCIDKSASDKKADIRDLSGLAEELEKKLEDLKQQVENPKQVLAELMGVASGKANTSEKVVVTPAAGEMSSSRIGTVNTTIDFGSPTVSTAHTGAGGGASSGITHLGVVGRGVKRVLMNQSSEESSPAKKLATEASSDKTDGKSS